MRYETLLCNAFFKHLGKEALPLIEETFANAGKKLSREIKVSKGEPADKKIGKFIKEMQEAKVLGEVETKAGNPTQLIFTERCISKSKMEYPELCQVSCLKMIQQGLEELGLKTKVSAPESRAAGKKQCRLEVKTL